MKVKDQYHKASELLERIFGNAPTDCESIRLGVRVWYGDLSANAIYILTDYLHFGGGRERTRFAEQREQLRFTQGQLDAAIDAHGWTMGQPSKRNTTEVVYTFTPSDGQHPFSLRSQTAQVAERRHQDRVFSQFASANWS